MKVHNFVIKAFFVIYTIFSVNVGYAFNIEQSSELPLSLNISNDSVIVPSQSSTLHNKNITNNNSKSNPSSDLDLNSIYKELQLDNSNNQTVISKRQNQIKNTEKNNLVAKLPSLSENKKHAIPLDVNAIKKSKTKNENIINDDICPTNLPCIPMYNRYVMKLDKGELTQANKVNLNTKISTYKELKSLTNTKLPSIAQFSKNNIPLDLSNPIKDQDPNKHLTISTNPYIADLLSKGIILVKDETLLPNVPKESPEDLKNASTNELIEQQQKLYRIINVTGDFLFAFSHANDKEAFIKSLGLTKANGIIDSNLNKFLRAYDGVNAELSTRLSVSKGNWKIQPEGKILFPLLSTPKSMTFMQGGITTGTLNRKIAHLALGERFYPNAKSFEDLGNDMFGANLVIDRDLTRKHLRGSIGFEYMHNNIKIISNLYRRLSSWRDSPDFEKGYVEERAASGWDLFVEYWIKSKLAIKAGLTHWLGRDISPFGDTNEKNLENSPYIYELGVKYTPVPAISLEMAHQRTTKSNSNTYFGFNFNIPIGDNFSFSEAFNPDALNKAIGNSILTSRSMFIERDYTMPLQYRSKPGMYYIKYVNQPGPNKYLFIIEDGFHRPAPFIPVTVKASHPSIKLSNNGSYISDAGGYFVVEVIQSAVTKATLTITAGNVTEEFNIEIQHLSYQMKADPVRFERFENSRVSVYIDTEDLTGIRGTDVKWRIKDNQPGTLNIIDDKIQADGSATVIYNPDTTQPDPYNVDVIATIYDVDFSITLNIMVYGNGANDFSASTHEIDGGNYATLTYENLKPNTTVDMYALGVCQIQVEQPEGPMDMTGTTTDGQRVTVPVDENGVATAYAVGSTVVGDSGLCKITTKTLDPYLNNVNAKADISSRVYDAQWVVPNSVLYLEPFTATLKNLKNETNVEFSALNDTANLNTFSTFSRLSSSSLRPRALMRMAAAPNNLNATRTVTVANNEASNEYMVTGDYTIEQVSGIHAKYYHDAFNTKTDTDASTLAIMQFTPFFMIDSENQRKLDIFSGDDTFVVKLTSGQPHRAIEIINPENNVTITAPETFDSMGEAEITIKGNDIRDTQSFTIIARALGKECTLSAVVAGGTLQYHVFEPNVVSFAANGGSNVYPGYETATYSGMPSFKNAANTIDYKTNYDFKLNGLRPETTVSVTADNGTVLLDNAVVDSDGSISGKLSEITDFDIKNVNLLVSYTQTSTEASRKEQTYSLNLFNYQPQIRVKSGYNDTIVADESTVLEVVEGKPNEDVNWSLTGNGEIVQKDSIFNKLGVAEVTVKGIAPFTDTLNKIDCYVLTMESSYNNYVYYIDYKGQEYATISWRSIWACDGYCLTEGSSSLSMRSTQENFIVTPHIQGGTFSYWSLYSKWYPHYYGVYDVIYSPRNKIVKKGNFSVSTTASEGGFVHYIYGSQEFLVSQ